MLVRDWVTFSRTGCVSTRPLPEANVTLAWLRVRLSWAISKFYRLPSDVCHQSRAVVGAGVCASCNALQRAYRLLRLEWRSLTSLIRLPAVLRIALYNLHFATLGGGERRTALLATHLARAHDVALFSAAPIDAAKISHLFDIDVSAVQNIVLPPDESQHAHSIAAWRPDLFINNSHASRLPCPAKRGIYM